MEFFAKVIQYIQQIPPKDMQRYTYITMGVMGGFVALTLFLVYGKNTDLVEQLKKMQSTAQAAVPLLRKYEALNRDEERIQAMLAKYQDEDIRSFFESFCKGHHMVPQPGWEPTTVALNPKFDEVQVEAKFHGITTQKLVDFLQAIGKESTEQQRILYTKRLTIKKDPSAPVINVDLTIATVRMKQEGES